MLIRLRSNYGGIFEMIFFYIEFYILFEMQYYNHLVRICKIQLNVIFFSKYC